MKIERHEWTDTGTGTWRITRSVHDEGPWLTVDGPRVDVRTMRDVLADEIIRLRRELEIARRALDMKGKMVVRKIEPMTYREWIEKSRSGELAGELDEVATELWQYGEDLLCRLEEGQGRSTATTPEDE